MTWFFYAILGPVLWSVTNHIDKRILDDQGKGTSAGALVLYSTLFSGAVLPILYILDNGIFLISVREIVTLLVAGALSAISLLLYLHALERDEASIVVPFFQLVPVFGFVFAYVILGELLTLTQLVGSVIVIIGAMMLSIDIDNTSGFRMKRIVPALMIGSSAGFALYEVMFKFIAVDAGFLVSSFWQYAGLLCVGMAMFLAFSKYRSDFISLIRRHTKSFFAINVLNESLTVAGNSFYNLALLIAPAALVMVTSGFQPVFVFLIGVVITAVAPRLGTEKVSLRHLAHKAICITLVVLGTFVLFS